MGTESHITASAPDDSFVIFADKLSKRFGDFTAVDAISFAVRRGEIFGFLGANGAGKTTAMRMLCGLLRPSDGSALVAGFDVFKDPDKIKQRIGYMSQKFSLYEDLTVWENIRFYAGIYGLRNAEIRSKGEVLLKQLKLDIHRNELVGSLPLGWKQKLAFSISIIHEPAIVFLDEPTGGVDPRARREFWEMIYAAARRGTTVFVTTHYMDEAEYCDRVSIMVDGVIACIGTPLELRMQNEASTMNEVFLKLARKAQRSAD